MYKKYFEGKKAVFFDLDGTLVITKDLWDTAFKNVLESIGLNWIDLTPLPEGMSIEDKWLYILATNESPDKVVNLKQVIEKTYEEFFKGLAGSSIDVLPGFWNFVLKLKEDKQMKIALVTNSPKNVTEEIMKKLGINHTFDFIFCGDEVDVKKPDPKIYLLALKNTGLSAREVLAFEDSVAGANASVKAGIDTIVIWNGAEPKIRYPEEITLFLSDFDYLDQSVDVTFLEKVQKDAQDEIKPPQEEAI